MDDFFAKQRKWWSDYDYDDEDDWEVDEDDDFSILKVMLYVFNLIKSKYDSYLMFVFK